MIVEVGAAIAVDAIGSRTEVVTRVADRAVEMVVPASWLRTAEFPIVIDPLITVGNRLTDSTALFAPAIGRDPESNTDNLMFVVSRASSSTDTDLFGYLSNDTFGLTNPVFSDVSASWSTNGADVAFVAGADRWIVAFQRHFSTTNNTRVRLYFHDQRNTALNSGLIVPHDPGSGETNWFPRVGGNHHPLGTDALLVYQADPGNNQPSLVSTVWGAKIDAGARSIGQRFQVSRVGSFDSENPDVNSASDTNPSTWVVVYEMVDTSLFNDDSDIQIARIRADGSVVGTFVVGPDVSVPFHKVLPHVEGSGGRYMVSIGRHSARGGDFSLDLLTERVDWGDQTAAPTLHHRQVLVPQSANVQLSHVRLGYDTNTRSHWAVAYQADFTEIELLRLGFSGGVVEQHRLTASAGGLIYAPAISFDRDRAAFQVVYLQRYAQSHFLSAALLDYTVNAVGILYGVGCGFGQMSSGSPGPHAGSEFFTIRLRGVPPGTVCTLVLAASRATLPLDSIGMQGCVLHLDPATLFLTDVRVMAGNAVGVELALPDRPVFRGDFSAQWAFLQPGLNTLGLGTSEGLLVRVR